MGNRTRDVTETFISKEGGAKDVVLVAFSKRRRRPYLPSAPGGGAQLLRGDQLEAQQGGGQLGAGAAHERVRQERREAAAALRGVERDPDHPEDLGGGGQVVRSTRSGQWLRPVVRLPPGRGPSPWLRQLSPPP